MPRRRPPAARLNDQTEFDASMFLVPTVLRRSGIHGHGVFAVHDIPAGTRVWEFTDSVDWRIPADDLAAFPEPWQAGLRRYCYMEPDGQYVLCGDNAKFMNHSESPNCDDSGQTFTIAIVDIPAGTELTCDYREFDAEWREDPMHGSEG